ncbi:hypothetical protein GCK32_008652 [Trichostrongylus colubriformis]|uniref:Uncharacterized protein n=1 Tax=Trichostrongylus colubriformis TaxID=6319 RepID=A0AAN8G2K9_TRICO
MMLLMIVLCFMMYAHVDNSPAVPERVGRISLPQSPLNEHDRLDDLAMAVFGYNVSTMKSLYSMTENSETYRNKQVFKEWQEKYGNTRDDSPEEALYKKVEEVFDNLAMSLYTGSAAMEALIAHEVGGPVNDQTHNFDSAMRIRLWKRIP